MRRVDITGQTINGIECLGNYIVKNKKTYWEWKCPYCGKIFRDTKNHIETGHTKSCGCLLHRKQYKDHSGEMVNGYIECIKYVKTNEYGKPVYLFKCPICGKLFEDTYAHVKHGYKSSCGCKVKSHGENKIIKILESNNINYKSQKWFTDCRDINPLPFDFCIYTKDSYYLIEFDGEQHFTRREDGRFGGEDDFETTQLHDQIKNKYCLNNNIPLIRIPYTHLHITMEDLIPETSQFLI